jgi:4-hydroxy-4-methyl-2-oxoglutarate aldolase
MMRDGGNVGTTPRPDTLGIEDACSRYSMIYTGAIADVLDEMGYRDQCLPSSIQGLTMDAKVAGVAMTVEGEATSSVDPEEVYIPVLKMLGDLLPGDVIVSQPNDSISAHLGELSSEAAQFRGARGAVIDGGTRDTGHILKLGFPVFCRYRTPRDIVGRWRLVAHGRPIRIGEVTIRRGDFIVGDKDGVVVIPQEIMAEVLVQSEEVVHTENQVRKAILQGVHPVDAYRKYGRF